MHNFELKDRYMGIKALMVKIKYWWSIGNSYIETVLSLKENQKANLCSIELLSAQGIENLLKCYLASDICFENKERDKECVELILNNFFRNMGHNLKKIFDHDISLKRKLNISTVKRVSNGLVDDYRLSMSNGNEISLKNLESARYGPFASNSNVVNGFFSEEMFIFLKNLSDISSRKIDEINNKLKQ